MRDALAWLRWYLFGDISPLVIEKEFVQADSGELVATDFVSASDADVM